MSDLHNHIDHTLLKADASPEDIIKLCDEAKEHKLYAVCVNSCYVYLAHEELKDSEVKLAATVGFPLGAASTKTKVAEAKKAIKDGADEIDMVMNVGFLKSGLHKSVKEDIESVKEVIGKHTLKVILETCLLTDAEKRVACLIAEKAGADFVKTSTGFSTGGATEADVGLMKEVVGDRLKIKASGGIRTGADALKFIALGADRIGTSDGVTLLNTQNL